MTNAITRDNLFRPSRPNPQTKAEITSSTARAITEAEIRNRESKTLKLRQARLEMEARQVESAPAKRRTAKKGKPLPPAAQPGRRKSA